MPSLLGGRSQVEGLGSTEHNGQKMRGEDPVSKVVGLPLSLVEVFRHLERGSHYAGVIDEAVESGFLGKEEFGCGYNGGEGCVDHCEECNMCFWPAFFDRGDGGVAFRGRASAHIDVGAMLCEVGDGVVSSASP